MQDPEGRGLLDELQGRYDIFSDDEIRLLQDGGISVSDTEQVDSESIGDIYDISSAELMQDLKHKEPEISASGPRRNGLTQELLDKEREIMEERYKYEKNHVQLDMAHQKATFLKRASELEREINRLRSEKKSLEVMINTQKKDFDYKVLEKEQRTKDELYELRKIQNKIENETPGLKHKLEQYRADLSQVLVSQESYLEMRSKPENK